MAMLGVNGVDIAAPSAMKVTVFDVSPAQERNAAGELVMDKLKQKRRLDLKWARLSGSDLAAILNAVGGGFFTVRYPDPMAGENVQISCCCGDRTIGILRMEGGVPVWTDVEMSWTER